MGAAGRGQKGMNAKECVDLSGICIFPLQWPEKDGARRGRLGWAMGSMSLLNALPWPQRLITGHGSLEL